MSKKNYHVNVRMATVLICSGGCLLQQMRGNGLAYMLVCLSLVLCLPSSSTHARQLKKEDPVGLGHCQWEAGSKTEPNLSGSIYETSWVKILAQKWWKLVFHECYMVYSGNLRWKPWPNKGYWYSIASSQHLEKQAVIATCKEIEFTVRSLPTCHSSNQVACQYWWIGCRSVHRVP